MLTPINLQTFAKGGSGLSDGTLASAIKELQGLTISPVAGAAAGVKMNIAAIREEDTILAALVQGGVTTVGVSEVQHITVAATGGHFKITWGGQQTASLLYNAAAATVQAALEALSNIAVGDVVVTGGPGDAGGTTPYVLTWSPYLGNVAEPTCQDVDMTGTATATPSTITAGVQQVGGLFGDDKANITIQPTKASGTLTFTGAPTDGQTFVVNDVTYTFKTTPTLATHIARNTGGNQAAYDAMAADTAAAINAYESRYLDGSTGHAVPQVVATSAAGVVTITSIEDGVGNGPVVTDTGSTITVDSTDPAAVTATFVSAGNTDAVTVNGVTFTVKTTPVDLDVDMAVLATDTLQAAELARAIRAYANKYGTLDATATNLLGVVTIRPLSAKKGNIITLTEGLSNVAVSGSGLLSGGTATGGIKSTTDLTGESLVVYWFNKTP